MSDWGFMTRLMPRVVAEIKEWRNGGCGGHVDECWRQGVSMGKPGWFYAREGSIAVGTPFPVSWRGVALEMSLSAHEAHGYVLMLAPLPEGCRLSRLLNANEQSARDLVDVEGRQRRHEERARAGLEQWWPWEVLNGAH